MRIAGQLQFEAQTEKITESELWGAKLQHNAVDRQGMSPPVAFEVDVDDVRVATPAKGEASDGDSGTVQERWKSWSPTSKTADEIEAGLEAAQKRKEVSSMMRVCIMMWPSTPLCEALLLSSHTCASRRPGAISDCRITYPTGMQAHVSARRSALASQNERAMRKAGQLKVEASAAATAATAALERSQQSASSRKQALLTASAQKGASEYSKACQMCVVVRGGWRREREQKEGERERVN